MLTVEERNTIRKALFTQVNNETRNMILQVATMLGDGDPDEDLFDGTAWYYMQPDNRDELDKVYQELIDNGGIATLIDIQSQEKSAIPTKVLFTDE